MTVNRLVVNGISYFGNGARKNITDEIRKRELKKVFLVTDKDLVRFNIASMIIKELEESNIPYEIFDNVKQNPTVQNVQSGVDFFNKAKADVIVAVGGGSVIDTSKGIAVIAANLEFYDVISLEGIEKAKKQGIPIIAVPTTAGTGSETTMDYVITNKEECRKMACMDTKVVPIVAILDSEIMSSMPKGLTAATAMDALTHAIEAYVCKGSWEISDMYALKAIELIGEHIEKAVNEPKDLEARRKISIAQYIAGRSFTNVGLGIVHSMAHPLSAYYDIPHGIANAVILPYVMEYNSKADYRKFKNIAIALGNEFSSDISEEEAAEKGIETVISLLKKINLPLKLKELGVKFEDIEKLSQSAFEDVSTLDNPREVTVKDIMEIYKEAY